MDKQPQKLKIVRDAILEAHKFEESLLNNPQIRQLQEIGKRHLEALKQVKKLADPIIRNISQKSEQVSCITGTIPTIDRNVFYRRPVEYDILEELKEMNKSHKHTYPLQESGVVIIYDTKEGSLDRNLGGKYYSHALSENGKRKKLLDILLERKSYVQTKELEDLLSCPTSKAVAKIVQTFNDYAINNLRLDDNMKLIQGKKGSGYHINPKIRIEKA